MKEIRVIESEEPLTLDKIKNFESMIHTTLPDDYKLFLLKYNGGHPIEDCFKLIEPINQDSKLGELAGVSWFFAIYEGEDENLTTYLNEYKDRLPRELIPIGRAYGGDILCIDISRNNYGKVYFWDHNNEVVEGEEPDYKNIFLIANSFTDFINSLHEYEEEEPER